jgi:hypothetical protein
MKAPRSGRAKPASPRASAASHVPPSRELLLRLDHLRSSVREVARAYLANLEHDILEIRAAVGGVKDGGGRKPTLRRAAMERMSEMLDDVTLKPHKGRRNDLKKVEKVIRGLQRLVARQTMPNSRSRG